MIVANVKRAVNDKTAKDMLGEAFRRQVLMDGLYGQLVFIATQTDSLLRSEICENLRLGTGHSTLDAALARNAFTTDRIRKDFVEGIVEMHAEGGEAPDARADIARKYTLPVFTCSAVEYQKLQRLRLDDGTAQVFQDVEDTGLPALSRFIHSNILRLVHAHVLRQLKGVDALLTTVKSVITQGPSETPDADLGCRIKEAIDGCLAHSKEFLAKLISNMQQSCAQEYDKAVQPKVTEGVADASGYALWTCQQWSHNAAPTPDRKRGMHWATYRAVCRRDGVWQHHSLGLINWNEELTNPAYAKFAVAWERLFMTILPRHLESFKDQVLQELQSFAAQVRAQLLQVTPSLPQLDHVERGVRSVVSNKVTNGMQAVKKILQDQQREISRCLAPTLQSQLIPTYNTALAESGTGSARRRTAIVETKVERHGTHMLQASAQPLGRQWGELLHRVWQVEVTGVMEGVLKDVATHYAVLHRGVVLTDPAEVARRMGAQQEAAPRLESLVSEHRAVQALADGCPVVAEVPMDNLSTRAHEMLAQVLQARQRRRKKGVARVRGGRGLGDAGVRSSQAAAAAGVAVKVEGGGSAMDEDRKAAAGVVVKVEGEGSAMDEDRKAVAGVVVKVEGEGSAMDEDRKAKARNEGNRKVRPDEEEAQEDERHTGAGEREDEQDDGDEDEMDEDEEEESIAEDEDERHTGAGEREDEEDDQDDEGDDGDKDEMDEDEEEESIAEDEDEDSDEDNDEGDNEDDEMGDNMDDDMDDDDDADGDPEDDEDDEHGDAVDAGCGGQTNCIIEGNVQVRTAESVKKEPQEQGPTKEVEDKLKLRDVCQGVNNSAGDATNAVVKEESLERVPEDQGPINGDGRAIVRRAFSAVAAVFGAATGHTASTKTEECTTQRVQDSAIAPASPEGYLSTCPVADPLSEAASGVPSQDVCSAKALPGESCCDCTGEGCAHGGSVGANSTGGERQGVEASEGGSRRLSIDRGHSEDRAYDSDASVLYTDLLQ